MPDLERCRYGWKAMASMFGKSESWIYQFRGDLERLGLIRYTIPGRGYKSASGKRISHPMVQWFPSDIRAYWRAQNKLDYEEKSGES